MGEKVEIECPVCHQITSWIIQRHYIFPVGSVEDVNFTVQQGLQNDNDGRCRCTESSCDCSVPVKKVLEDL
jgi:L-lactate utilization protein LutB